VKLKNLNALHLTRLYRQRLDSGLSGSTVQKIHHVLHKGLGQAVRWHLIPRNPADDVKAPTPAAKDPPPLPRLRLRRGVVLAPDGPVDPRASLHTLPD
jgi:integrase